MSVGRTLGVVVVSVLLTVTLFGATVATGVDRTALDEEYVTERFANEEVDSEIATVFRTNVGTEVNRSGDQQQLPTGISVDLDGERIANRSVTDEFVRTELRRNVGAIVAYLRGDSDGVDLTTNLRPIKESVRAELINATEVDTPVLVGANTDRVGSERVAMLSSGEQEYREARVELSNGERAEVEAEIEQNVRQQLGNDSERLQRSVIDHQQTVLDGLTGEVGYDEYLEQLAADERAIKAAIADVALRAVPDEEPLFGGDSTAESELEQVRAVTRPLVTLAWLAWLVAAVLVGGTYLLTRSAERTGTVSGTALVVSGLLGAVLGFVAGPLVKNRAGLGGDDPNALVGGLVAVVDGTLRTVGRGSLLLVVAGVVVLVVVAADRRGLFDGLRRRIGIGPRR